MLIEYNPLFNNSAVLVVLSSSKFTAKIYDEGLGVKNLKSLLLWSHSCSLLLLMWMDVITGAQFMNDISYFITP